MWGISSLPGPLCSTAGMASEKIGTHLVLFSPLRDLDPRAQLEKQKHRERRIIKVLFFTTSPPGYYLHTLEREEEERKKKRKKRKERERRRRRS